MDNSGSPIASGITRAHRAVWLAAVAVAASLHVGAFGYALLTSPPSEKDNALGAPAIEIGLELKAPHMEDNSLPLGPETEDSAASLASVNQAPKVDPTDLPKEQPVETDDPDRVVAPEAPKHTQVEKPKVVESVADHAADSVASEATAPPKIEAAHEAPEAVAPALGTGDSALLVKMKWQKQLVAHLNRFKHYPRAASRRSAEIVVAFTLDRFGHVMTSSLQRSSGDRDFDQAALDMVKHADPVPAPPPLVADQGLSFAIPVLFHERHR